MSVSSLSSQTHFHGDQESYRAFTKAIAPMASFSGSKASICFALALLFLVQGTIGGITCESLDSSTCAFSVSSSGTRCVLEKLVRRGGQVEFLCRTSEVDAEKNLMDRIETDECIEACGLDRNTVGISSDSLLDEHFTQKLCSPQCYKGCPNIIDLYFNLAAGEGVFLPKLCEEQAIIVLAEAWQRSGALVQQSSSRAGVSGASGEAGLLSCTVRD